jgi:hypothetical protein
MSKYQSSKIYKIYSDVGDKVYIGCTTKKYLSQRMAKHKYDYTYYKKNREETGFAFVTSYLMFDEYGVDNCKIELLELYPCNSIDEIRKREAHYIKTIPNINNCHNWTQERINAKKETERQQAKLSYEKNKTELNKKSIEYYAKNKELIIEKRNLNKEKYNLKRREKYHKMKSESNAVITEPV